MARSEYKRSVRLSPDKKSRTFNVHSVKRAAAEIARLQKEFDNKVAIDFPGEVRGLKFTPKQLQQERQMRRYHIRREAQKVRQLVKQLEATEPGWIEGQDQYKYFNLREQLTETVKSFLDFLPQKGKGRPISMSDAEVDGAKLRELRGRLSRTKVVKQVLRLAPGTFLSEEAGIKYLQRLEALEPVTIRAPLAKLAAIAAALTKELGFVVTREEFSYL